MPFLNRTVLFALPTRRKQNPPARRAVRPMARLLKRSHVEAVSTSTDVPASLTSRLSPLAAHSRSFQLEPCRVSTTSPNRTPACSDPSNG